MLITTVCAFWSRSSHLLMVLILFLAGVGQASALDLDLGLSMDGVGGKIWALAEAQDANGCWYTLSYGADHVTAGGAFYSNLEEPAVKFPVYYTWTTDDLCYGYYDFRFFILGGRVSTALPHIAKKIVLPPYGTSIFTQMGPGGTRFGGTKLINASDLVTIYIDNRPANAGSGSTLAVPIDAAYGGGWGYIGTVSFGGGGTPGSGIYCFSPERILDNIYKWGFTPFGVQTVGFYVNTATNAPALPGVQGAVVTSGLTYIPPAKIHDWSMFVPQFVGSATGRSIAFLVASAASLSATAEQPVVARLQAAGYTVTPVTAAGSNTNLNLNSFGMVLASDLVMGSDIQWIHREAWPAMVLSGSNSKSWTFGHSFKDLPATQGRATVQVVHPITRNRPVGSRLTVASSRSYEVPYTGSTDLIKGDAWASGAPIGLEYSICQAIEKDAQLRDNQPDLRLSPARRVAFAGARPDLWTADQADMFLNAVEWCVGLNPGLGNRAPLVFAGDDQSRDTAPWTVNLAGTLWDADGQAMTSVWSTVSGPGTVTFGDDSAVNTSASFSLPGTYTLRLSASDSLASGSDEVVISVAASVSITASDAEASEPGLGLGGGVFNFTRNNSSGALTVNYTVSGTAFPGADYEALPGSVSMADGQTSATVTVIPIDDSSVEELETVTIAVAAGPGYQPAAVASATVTIADDEVPILSISASDNAASEPGRTDGNGAFTISRFPYSTVQALTVKLAYGGTATSGSDNVALPTTVTMPAGISSLIVTVTPLDDLETEPIDTVVASLLANNGYSVGANASATVNIHDDEPAQVVVELNDADCAEGAAANPGSFYLRRLGLRTAAITVAYTLGGTATSGSDYTPLSGTASIAANGVTATVIVTPVNDALVEGTETVILTVAPGAGYSVGSPSNATLNIRDDEVPAVTVSVQDAICGEPAEAGSFRLTRSPSSASELTVNYTIGGTAGNGSDYAALSGTATIAAGATTVDVLVSPVDDALAEGAESVILTLAPGGVAYNIGATSTHTIWLRDDELPRISAVASDAAASETGGDTGTFTLSASPAPSTDLTVTYTLGGSAVNGLDYEPLASSVVIPAGQTTVTVVVSPVDDPFGEGAETVTLILNQGSGYSVATTSAMTVTIAASDKPVAMVHAYDPTASESPLQAGTFRVLLSNPTSTSTILAYTVGGTATSGSDYTPLTGSLTIPSGSISGLITVTPIADGVTEDGETVTVTLTAASSYVLETPVTASLGIVDVGVENRAPVLANAIADQTAVVGTAFSLTLPIDTFSDPDGDSLVWSSNEALGWLGFNAATRTFSGIPAVEDAATTNITVWANDGLLAASDDFALTVSFSTVAVFYDANGATSGSAPESQTKIEGVTLVLATNSGSLARTGYVFAGWNTRADGTGTSYAAGADYTDEVAVPLYAKWTALACITSVDSLAVVEGASNTFQIKLPEMPAAMVTVAVARVSGDSDLSVSPASLTFTTADWNIYQTVTVSAAQDLDITNGSAVIRCSSAALANANDVTVTEVDDEILTIETWAASQIVVKGKSITLFVWLSYQPTSSVSVSVANISGDSGLSVAPASLTFSTANWRTFQLVTVSAAQDDDDTDGSAIIRLSSAGLANTDVTFYTLSTALVVTVESGENGIVTPSGEVTLPVGGHTNFLVTADPYYHIASLKTNNTDIEGSPFYNSDLISTNFVWDPVLTDGTFNVEFAANMVTNGLPGTATPEWWLAAYHGPTNFSFVNTNDTDGDGMLSWQEYVADTDPTDRNSALRIIGLVYDADGLRIDWQGGSSVTQYLERSYNFTANPIIWQPVFTNRPPTALSTNILDPGNTNDRAYYRIRVGR